MDKLKLGIDFFPVKDAPNDTVIPVRATDCAAGHDMFAPEDIEIMPFDTTDRIKLNVKLVMPRNFYGKLENRSSMRDRGIELCCGGVIDADYANNEKNDGNIMIRLQNHTNRKQFIAKGSAVCQCIIQQYFITDSDNVNNKRVGGFGSTNK